MNETINRATGEKIKYNRIGGTADNPIYFNDPVPTQTQPLNQAPTAPMSATTMTQGTQLLTLPNIKINPVYNEMVQDVGTRTQSQIDIATQEAEALQRAGGGQADQARNAFTEAVQNVFQNKSDVQAQQATLEEQAGLSLEQKALREINTEIANTNVALRAEQDRIRNTPMSKGQAQIDLGNVQDTFGRRLADLAIRQSASQGNISAIQSDVERKIKLALAPIENKIEYFKTFGKDNLDALTAKENQKLNLIVNSLEKQKAETKELEEAKGKMVLELAQNGGGNSQFVQQIQNAKTLADVYTLGAKSGYVGSLDRQLKQAQLAKVYRELRDTDNKDMASFTVNALASQGNPKTNKEVLASILAGKAVSAGTKGRLAPANSVMTAIESFADERQTGEFVGMGLFGRAKEFYKGLVNAESPESILNKQNIEAINLKVQQWASGASLTEQQTKQVNKLTPKSGDSDKVARTKMSGLYNYMLKQVESDLLTDGVNVYFKPVNLFETYDLLQTASPEQLTELKNAGLIQ